jgi:hypothetical protein
MTDGGEKRRWLLHKPVLDEEMMFKTRNPRRAAIKVAREIAEKGEDSESAPRCEIVMRQEGEQLLHFYRGWSWGDRLDETNVRKTGVKFLEED